MSKRLTTEEFINRAKKIHGNKYSYDLVEYKNNSTKIKIICPKHGEFEQSPKYHLKSYGCKKCGIEKMKENKTFNKENFLLRAIKIHGNKYSYDLINYKNISTKIKILCPKHGIFKQLPYVHLQGCGCPICKESKGEKEIRQLLEENNIKFISQKTFENCKHKSKLLFDFYLPKLNICIEYDGIQHFEPIEYFGGKKELTIIKKRDKIKDKYCKENDIKLIRIKYNENIERKLNCLKD